MMTAVNLIKLADSTGKQSNVMGQGAQLLFTISEEDCLYSYICLCATHGEALTQLEFLNFASNMLKHLRPELHKVVVENQRECSPESGR